MSENKQVFTDNQIFDLYDSEIAKGGSADSVILRTCRAIEAVVLSSSAGEKKDAERYRWLREGHRGCYNNVMVHAGARLDEAVDDAIRATNSMQSTKEEK